MLAIIIHDRMEGREGGREGGMGGYNNFQQLVYLFLLFLEAVFLKCLVSCLE